MIEFPHPAFTSFVFPLFFLSLIFEGLRIFFYRNFTILPSTVSIFLAIIFCFISYYTGFNEYESLGMLTTDKNELIEKHQFFAKILLVSLIPTLLFAVLRHFNHKQIIFIFFYTSFALSLSLSFYTSQLGGNLVFKQGIGVRVSENSK